MIVQVYSTQAVHGSTGGSSAGAGVMSVSISNERKHQGQEH